jgi:hypothetical protein
MKSIATLLLSLLLLCFLSSSTTLACKCIEPATATKALNTTDAVFRGHVVRQLPMIDATKRYVVRVGRVFKGCAAASSSFTVGNRIIVSTGTHSCGSTLSRNKHYVFSGSATPIDATAKKQLGKNTKITQDVNINLCSYYTEWDVGVSADDKKVLRQYVNNSSCGGPQKCTTGKDCQTGWTCDTGICVDYNAACPADRPPAPCAGDPCIMAKPCQESTCVPYFCGGCYAFFVDTTTGTRVCN